MPATFHEARKEKSPASPFTMLELTVNNHPGVMSHVCGLLTRRGWNVEGMVSLPGQRGALRSIWLLVNAEGRLGQVIKQVAKLQDVLHVHHRGSDEDFLGQLEELMTSYSADQQGAHPVQGLVDAS